MLNEAAKVLVNEELIRILLETYHVVLIFNNYGIDLLESFQMQLVDGTSVEIDGNVQKGDVNVLWKQIGSKVKEVYVDHGLSIIFDNGNVLRVNQHPEKYVMSIKSLDLKIWEDF